MRVFGGTANYYMVYVGKGLPHLTVLVKNYLILLAFVSRITTINVAPVDY
jgi:hypothetical protein